MASLFPPRAADATFADDLGTEFVTIFVGPERKKYAVHKKLLTSQSEYFDKALNGGFKEAEENSIHLEEDDPDAIALLIGWLYRGVIPGPAAQSIFIEGAFPPSTTETTLLVGGTSVAVVPYSERDPNRPYPANTELNVFQSILAHPQYSSYSSEELRLADYKEGRRYGEGEDPDLQVPVPPVTGGLFANALVGNPPSLFGPTRPTQAGGGFGTLATIGGGFGAAPPHTQTPGSGLFGSLPTVGRGTGVTQLAQGASLFSNPPPSGSSLFGPSAVASSGGIFVNLPTGTGTQPPPSSGLFGNQPAATGTSAAPSGGLFGNWPQSSTYPPPWSETQSASAQTTTAGNRPFGAPSDSTQNQSPPLIYPNVPPGGVRSLFAPPYPTSPGNFGWSAPSPANTSQSAAESTSPNPIPGLTSNPFCLGGPTTQPASSSTSTRTPSASNTTSLADAVNSVLNLRGETSSAGGVGSQTSVQSSASSTPADTSSQDPVSNGDALPSITHDTLTALASTSTPTPSDSQSAPSSVLVGSSTATQDTTSVPPPTQLASTSSTIVHPSLGQSTTSTPTITPNSPDSDTPSLHNPPQHPTHLPAWMTPVASPFTFRKFNDITSQNPFDTTFSTYTTSPHQLALLNLTLFAETTCWPALYNASITSYMAGERTLTRPPPLEHITLIYERTHDESTLRTWAVDNLAAFKGEVDMSSYMVLLVEYEGFLEGVLKKLRESGQLASDQERGFDGAGGLKYRMLEHGKKDLFGKGKGGRNFFGGSKF